MEESAVRRPRVRDLNAHLICVLCGGYYVDATTIVDCLHSFCRSCIVRHLETSKFCPICDVQVHKAKPLHSIRPDRTLQTLVYKMVPCLYQAEVQRRREFFAKNGVTAVTPEQSGLDDGFFSPDDSISLSLEYYDSEKADDAEDSEDADVPNQDTPLRRRYLQCPAAVSMKHLKKFIRMKFGLSSEHRVDIIYAGECLRDDFTLMDVAYTFAWKRNAPMRFSYRIFHPPLYCVPPTPTKSVSTSMPERAAAPPQLQPQEEQPPQQDPLSTSSSTSTKVSESTPSRTESSENNGDSSVPPEVSLPSPQAGNKDDVVNIAMPETETTREEAPAVEEEDEEDNEEEMEEPVAEQILEDEEPPHKKLCIDERKCDDDSGYEAVETREQDEEEREVEEEGEEEEGEDEGEEEGQEEDEAAMEVTEEQEVEESVEQEKVEEMTNTETEYKIIEQPLVEKRVSTHKSKRRRKSSHAKEKERSRMIEEPEEVQQTIEENEAEENEEEDEAAAVTQVAEEEEQHEEEEEEEEQQEEQQQEEEEEEETEFQEQETVTTPVEEPAPAEEQENEQDITLRSSTSDEEEEEHAEIPPSTKHSKSSERQRESKEERRRYSKDSEERRRSKSKRDGSSREYGSRKKSKHKSKHHHRGDDTSSKKQRKAHRLLSEVTASTPTILQYQEDVMKLKVKLGPIKPVIANLAAAAAANHQHRHHHHHHHSKHSRKLQEAKESQASSPEARSPSPTGEIWECSTVPPKTNTATTGSTATTTTSTNTNTSPNNSPSASPPPTASNESSSGISAPVSVSSSGTTTTTTTTTASTVTTTSVTTVNNTLNNAINSTKERLLQMRAVRHKNITSNKSSDFSSSPESKQEETNNVNNRNSPSSMSEILMPSSSITVSKVPMGEKRKFSAQKPNNTSGSDAKRPSLEIMLVNAPSTTAISQSTNSSSSSSSLTSKQCPSSEATEKKGTALNEVPKANRPPPPTIPLVKIRKSSVSSIRAPAGLIITPKLPSSPTSSSSVSNVPSMSCTTVPKSPISLKMSPVSSPQLRPESGNKQGNSEEQAMRHDDIGALDLSGKSSRCKSSGSSSSSPQAFYRSQSSPGAGSKGSSSSPASSIMTIAQNLVQRQLTNLQHQNSNNTESPTSNGNAKSPGGGESTSNSGVQGVGSSPALTNLKTLSDTAVHIRNMMAAQSTVKIPQQKVQAGNSPSLNRPSAPYNCAASRNNTSLPAHMLQQSQTARSSTAYHPTLPNTISPLRIPVPPSQLSKGNASGNGTMPRLRELFPGGVAGRGRGAMGPQNRTQMKPGQNQAVRQIPNPSALLFRQTQNRLQQNAGGMASQNRLHISPSVNSINKPVYNSPGLSTANSKPNNAVPPVSSIRKIENMTRNIEKVAAGLTVRAVEAHVSNK